MSGPAGFDEALASLPVGTWFTGRSRTITAGEMTLLAAVSHWGDDGQSVARVTGDDDETQLDPHLALAVVLSLATAGPLFARLELEHRLVVAAALRHSAVLHAAIPAGCTLTTRSTLVSYRRSAGTPGRVVVTVHDEAHDDTGKALMTIERVVLMSFHAASGDGADS